MSYASHVAGSTRIFDHLYDPLYITSGKKDVWRANTFALSVSAPVHILSNFKSMFSDLPNRPRYKFYRQQNPLPHIPITGGAGDAENMHHRAKQAGTVDGKARWRYFHYPPILTKTISLQLDIPTEEFESCRPRRKHQTIGCQTQFRESSAQTKPYMPEAIVVGATQDTPELLLVANLITGDHQPGVFEAKVIERARKRRQWEKSLPQLQTKEDWEKRRTVLEAFEWEEWMAREEEIQDCQSIRFDLVKNLMQKREDFLRKSSDIKIKEAFARIEEDRNKKLTALQQKKARSLRKLEMNHRKCNQKYHEENIVTEHVDRASDLYAPQMRFGVHPKRGHFIASKKDYEATLDEFERKELKQTSLRCDITRLDYLTKPKKRVKEITRGFCSEKQLKNLYETLKFLRMKQQKEPIKCLEPPMLTPTSETPVGVEEDVKAEAEFQCSVFLGKVIKGRAVQNILYRGRDLNRDNINDLQSKTQLSAVLAIHPDAKNQQRKMVLAHQKHLQRIVNNKKHASEVMKQSEASSIGSLLDFIEKELQRLQEQRKIQAICMLAEREKIKRETAEAKREQTQILRTRQHEEIYRSMMKASHETVTMYLENVLLEEVENQSDIDARRKIQSMARRIDREASKDIGSQRQMESSLEETLDGSEEVVTDLVTKFIFPEVQKRLARRNMEVRQQSYLLAAHQDLYKEAKDMTGTSMVQGQPSYQEREKVASSLLNDLIKRVISSDDAFGELKSERDIARQEALEAVKKIVKTIFPSRKWQTSGEKIANATVNDIIRRAVQPKKRQRSFLVRQERVEERPSELLQEIVHDVGEKLWEYAVADVDEETAKIIADDYRYVEGEATSEGSPDGSERKQIVSEEIEGDEKDVETSRNLSPDGIAVEKLQKYSDDEGDDDGNNN